MYERGKFAPTNHENHKKQSLARNTLTQVLTILLVTIYVKNFSTFQMLTLAAFEGDQKFNSQQK